jgi:hypothetical protein
MKMRRLTASAVGLLVLGAIVPALADTIDVTVTATTFGTNNQVTLAPGDTAKVAYKVIETSGGGDAAGCNVSPTAPATLSISYNASGVVSAQPASLTFTSCDTSKEIVFTAGSIGNVGATPVLSGGVSGSKWNTSQAKVNFKVEAPADTTAPALSLQVPTPDGLAGWFVTAPVVVTASATDASKITSLACTGGTASVSGIGTSAASATISVSAQGISTVACTATDESGNSSSESASVKIDTVAPVSSIQGLGSGQFTASTLPSLSCAATDATSGVDNQGSLAVTGGNANGVGAFSAACSGATDVAGNSAASSNGSYRVSYADPSGILQPINPDNTSVFKRGHGVPVKFRLGEDAPFGYVTTGWTITRQAVSCSTSAASLQEESVTSNTPSVVFRYDSNADQYIYNADFKSASMSSCWRIRVTLDDSTGPGTSTVLTSATFRVA